ncbi:FlgD immunoglobulin-like domain containing protein [Candidatus Latescibacterota bacterium]
MMLSGKRGVLIRGATVPCLAVLALTAAPSVAAHGIFVVTTDFTTGSTAYLPPGAEEAQIGRLPLHGDLAVRYAMGKVYVIERLPRDNIVVYDAGDPGTLERQFSVGNGTNPQDIAVVSPERAYVTRYEVPTVLIVNPTTGDSLGHVDLSAFADADGIPEMGEMVVIGTRLYVSVQRLDRSGFPWTTVDVSYLVIVDAASGQIVDADPEADGIQGIRLAAANPNSLIRVGGRIAVSGAATLGDVAGGIEIVDPAGGQSTGLVVTEEALGGDITHLSLASATKGYAIVSDADYVNSVVPVDLATGAVGQPLTGLSGGYLQSTAVDGDRLYVAERGTYTDPGMAGLMVFDTTTDQLVAGPIPTGLPPAYIAVMADRGVETAIAEEGGQPLPRSVVLGRAFPNPFNASTVIPFDLSQPGAVRLVIFDVLGRPVRTLVAGVRPAGSHRLIWDGRTDGGAPAGNGPYLVGLQTPSQQSTRKVMLLK